MQVRTRERERSLCINRQWSKGWRVKNKENNENRETNTQGETEMERLADKKRYRD